MARESADEFRNGELWNGYDRDLQTWVLNGRVARCGHGANMGPGTCCNSRRYSGLMLESARKLEAVRAMAEIAWGFVEVSDE